MNPNLCPATEVRYDRPVYESFYFGYSVTGRWSACGDLGENELRPWDSIPSPSEYPWFADPLVERRGLYIAEHVFGRTDRPQFGLGFEHPGESGNAVFADGHAQTYQADRLTEQTQCGIPDWLLAVKPR